MLFSSIIKFNEHVLAALDQAAAPAVDDFGAMLVNPPSVGGGDSGVDLAAMDYQPTPPGNFLSVAFKTFDHSRGSFPNETPG